MVKLILSEVDRRRNDESNDFLFYEQPRFVHHLDSGFRSTLTKLYREQIPKNSVVLDMMSSWVSHLPNDVLYNKIIGHGMNEKELLKNNRLDDYWIQNLNTDFLLPLADSSVDSILIVAGWQYLTNPEIIASEALRISRPGGKIIVSFSNRAFWDKTPRIWYEGNDNDHIIYISNILTGQGWTNIRVIKKHIFRKIPLFRSKTSDPFFSVIAEHHSNKNKARQ